MMTFGKGRFLISHWSRSGLSLEVLCSRHHRHGQLTLWDASANDSSLKTANPSRQVKHLQAHSSPLGGADMASNWYWNSMLNGPKLLSTSHPATLRMWTFLSTVVEQSSQRRVIS